MSINVYKRAGNLSLSRMFYRSPLDHCLTEAIQRLRCLNVVLYMGMDAASQALAQELPSNIRRTYAILAERGHVPFSTAHHHAHGRPSKADKAQGQQYLVPDEETGLANFLLLMSNLGHPVRIKHVPSLALSVKRQRHASDSQIKPPGKNWAQAFERRHPELKTRRVKVMDWKRHENIIYHKITHWFEVIGTVLQDKNILREHVYNMDETGVMLSMLGTVKVLSARDDLRDYRGAGVKRTIVTAIECISANGRCLLPLIIWPASTHRSNWTTYSTPMALRAFRKWLQRF